MQYKSITNTCKIEIDKEELTKEQTLEYESDNYIRNEQIKNDIKLNDKNIIAKKYKDYKYLKRFMIEYYFQNKKFNYKTAILLKKFQEDYNYIKLDYGLIQEEEKENIITKYKKRNKIKDKKLKINYVLNQ